MCYARIVGTRFRQKPIAEIEFQNGLIDCEAISKTNSNLTSVGDSNTLFFENEKEVSIENHTTNALKKLLEKLKVTNLTVTFEQNIDLICVPKRFKDKGTVREIFIEKV
jgi:hypothetical protein